MNADETSQGKHGTAENYRIKGWLFHFVDQSPVTGDGLFEEGLNA
jgi:hypothetical protein